MVKKCTELLFVQFKYSSSTHQKYRNDFSL